MAAAKPKTEEEVAPPPPPEPPSENEKSALGFQYFQARLGFWQAIWGTIISGGIAVAIPAAVDLYRIMQETNLKQVDARIAHIDQFLDEGLNQDIELRIRMAEYFAFVAPPDQLSGWNGYRDALTTRRGDIRKSIADSEAELARLLVKDNPTVDDQIRIEALRRELEWNYAEVGYAQRDTNITVPDRPSTVAVTTDRASIAAEAESLFAIAQIRSDRAVEVDALADKIASGRDQYEVVATATGVPWYIVGAIHQLETGGEFDEQWSQTATDAFNTFGMGGLVGTPLTLGNMLYASERYNGSYYRLHGHLSPYIWGCTDQYAPDSSLKINPNYCGVAAMLKALVDKGVITLP